jgi:hypothetical protein
MKRTKIIETRTQTVEREIVGIYLRTVESTVFCPQCQAFSRWLSLADAKSDAGLTFAEVCALIEIGKLHSQLTGDGHLLVCGRSLECTTKQVIDVPPDSRQPGIKNK